MKELKELTKQELVEIEGGHEGLAYNIGVAVAKACKVTMFAISFVLFPKS